MAAEPLDARINQIICTITGAPEARSGQIQAVKSLYHQKDTILVAATGYGKSAVLYAVGALTKKMTIQIVPLSKLGQNQCEDIEKKVTGSTPVFVDGDTPVKVGIWSGFLLTRFLLTRYLLQNPGIWTQIRDRHYTHIQRRWLDLFYCGN